MARNKDDKKRPLKKLFKFAGRALVSATGTYFALWFAEVFLCSSSETVRENCEEKRRNVASRGIPLSEVTVKSGDTLSALVFEYMGDAARGDIEEVLSLNNDLTDANSIFPGQCIVMPDYRPSSIPSGKRRFEHMVDVVMRLGDETMSSKLLSSLAGGNTHQPS
ncbi:hypothetical protein BSKO_04951 [Bryopsis sp. KO-2023]|nr:hypothetical protein BSKO_04951 [Bryopsis sp. KO-2023]